ncbi:biotin-dependent carboxyltransferase family protein [Algibacter mikhailovii]|uniref:5-oxoprolinase subunit C family protein n=1 Tax=Algibacter mikhailovii TaxID=425498 RepID=UPI0024956994|nr:biotin-dependent carboxyltransferase family protein [Algibacter mikhailovii]
MIKVLKPGLFSAVQDLGRFGYQDLGVPYSGVMDMKAAKIANVLLNNSEDSAVLEMTMTGPTLHFNTHTIICLTGADISAKLNSKALSNYELIKVQPNDILSFGALRKGFRCYLAIMGGFKTEICMQSRSMYTGVTSNNRLLKGDHLEVEEKHVMLSDKNAGLKIDTTYMDSPIVDVFRGPEFHLLSKEQQKELLNNDFSISNYNNRMAYQLNELLDNNLSPIITSPVLPGTVQLTPSGKIIILMRDCQTTGGYPRIFQLTAQAINSIAQKRTGQNITFSLFK